MNEKEPLHAEYERRDGSIVSFEDDNKGRPLKYGLISLEISSQKSNIDQQI